MVDADGMPAFTCKRASSCTIRHWAVNDIAWRTFTAVGIPSSKEPPGLARTDDKCPDGLSLIPGKQENLSLGMWQWSVHWHLKIVIMNCTNCCFIYWGDSKRSRCGSRACCRKKSISIVHYPLVTSLNQLQLISSGHLIVQKSLFCQTLGPTSAVSAISAEIRRKLPFCSSDYMWPYVVSTPPSWRKCLSCPTNQTVSQWRKFSF